MKHPSYRPKPPLGILPESLWHENRLADLLAAVARYSEAGAPCPPQWQDEIKRRQEGALTPPGVHQVKFKRPVGIVETLHDSLAVLCLLKHSLHFQHLRTGLREDISTLLSVDFNSLTTVWVCGKAIEPLERTSWEFQGVFDTEEKAKVACRGDSYFIGPATLNSPLPDSTLKWEGSYYPNLQCCARDTDGDGNCLIHKANARGGAMSRKIYLASSWRNPAQPALVSLLRKAGHEVYDFRNPAPGNTGFKWSDVDPLWQCWTPTAFRERLNHPISERGFSHDWGAMQWADTGVLLLPSGRSAHIEAGYFVGAKKPLVILLAEGEPELMYKMASHICVTADEVVTALGTLPNWYGSESDQWKQCAEELADSLEPFIPESNCSCHINPPCGDCTDYAKAREDLEAFNSLKGVK